MNKSVVFDLDGTLYFGEEAAAEAKDVIEYLRKNGYNIFYLTNNSTKTREQIREKLDRLGFHVTASSIYTSAYATAVYLRRHNRNRVLLLGSEGLEAELHRIGIEVIDTPQSAQAVVVGLNTSFTYHDIARAMHGIEEYGLDIIACNLDRNFPIAGGRKMPGTNALVSGLLGSLSTPKEVTVVGKPSPYLLELIAEDHHLQPQEICIVGDSEESDIRMAKTYGCPWVLVGENGVSQNDICQIEKGLK